MKYDFTGWATRNNLRCSDGRTIMKDAFKHNDGMIVPLVWNHRHDEPGDVLGHALLKNVDDGVRVYGTFNNTESGAIGKALVQHGDITSLSIYANQLKQDGGNVLHGNIREVSLVHAGANPGAYIDSVMYHSVDGTEKEDAIIYSGYDIDPNGYEDDYIEHADDATIQDVFDTLTEEQKTAVYAIIGSILENGGEMQHSAYDSYDDILDTLDDDQWDAVNEIIGAAVDEGYDEGIEDGYDEGYDEGVEDVYDDLYEDYGYDEGDYDDDMTHNVFESDYNGGEYLSHADQEEIIKMAKQNNVGSLRDAIGLYFGEDGDSLAHGFEDIESLFPEPKDIYPGAPELITRDMDWVATVMAKTHKSPISRVRTRQTDVRDVTLRAKGYKTKGEKKTAMEEVTLVQRTTDPQTVYIKDSLNRDDIVDITDFDIVEYEYKIMRMLLNEEIARAILIGDGRDDTDADKISPNHIRPIWGDADLYTIHGDVDFAAAKSELQGTETGQHFGENYIYAEAIITKALYLREKYKGTGKPDFFCTPHLLNIMLLARDLNGRRIYDSEADLAKALNVDHIFTVEQFEDKTREVKVLENGQNKVKTKKLLGIFVNLTDYQLGSTKGGEITKFNQFDIDFNKEKYLIETRLSGALKRIYSAMVLEEDVTSTASNG